MFFRSFRTQFYIMVHQIGFQIAFIIVLLSGLINTACWLSLDYIKGEGVDASGAFLLNYYAPVGDQFSMLSLFLLMLPYCFTGLKNRDLHIDLLHIVRGNNRNYYIAGALTAFCGTVLIFFLPLMIELLINQIFFTSTGMLADGFSIFGRNGGSLVWYDCLIPIEGFIRHPFLYNTVYALLYAMFMGIVAVMMYGISLYLKKNIYLFFPVYILYFGINRIGDIVHSFVDPIIQYDFLVYFKVTCATGSNIYISLVAIGMLMVSIILIRYKVISDQGVSG